MAVPNPGNYGTDPGDFSGRDYALGRFFYGDGGGSGGNDDGGGCGCGCFVLGVVGVVVAAAILVAVYHLLFG